jgi:hypothetical protein
MEALREVADARDRGHLDLAVFVLVHELEGT